MPQILVPNPWTEQPQYVVEADEHNDLNRGRILSINPAIGEAGGKVLPVYYGTAAQSVSIHGKTYYADDTANDAVAFPLPATHPLYSVTTQFTIALWLDVSSSADYCNFFSVPYRAAGWDVPYNSLVVFKNGAAGAATRLQWAVASTTTEAATAATEIITTGFACYVFTRNGDSVAFYKNGVLVETVTVASSSNIDWNEKRPVVLLNSSDSSLPNAGFSGHHHGLDLWNRAISADEIKQYFANRWQLYQDEEFPVWFSVGVGPTLIELTTANFTWTKNPIQNRSAATMSAPTLKFTGQSIQNRSTITATIASLKFTAQSIQNKATAALTTASLKFVAQAINVANGTATTLIELTTAAFNYSAKALQFSQRMALSMASLVFSPKAIQNRRTMTLTAATLSFLAKALQNKLTIALSVASFSFIAWAIDVTGAVASVVARLLTLLGVGS